MASASSVKTLNPKAEVMGPAAALFMNINAANGLASVLKSNLGPNGTIKMLVGGAGDVKLTKDGNVLLRDMQIQSPTAVMIARAASAVDDATGDGTSTAVLTIGELMKQSERHLGDGCHPRHLVEGFEIAKKHALAFLEDFKRPLPGSGTIDDPASTPDGRDSLRLVARTALRTKLSESLADALSSVVLDAVLTVRNPKNKDEPIDLFMVEIMHMKHKLDRDTRLVKGLVLDHGARHPDMPKRLEASGDLASASTSKGDAAASGASAPDACRPVYILTCNIGLEYERSEVNAGFFYSSAEQREKLVAAERATTDERVQKIIDLKNKVCGPDGGRGGGFVVVNQKGIDPLSLDALAKNGILALRRAKRRNMERLVLACGGVAVNSVEELTSPPDEILGRAGLVFEHTLGEEKYTFVEDVPSPRSCTILVKGPADHTLAQIKDALRDGLRAVKNAIEDDALVPGAGAFEVAAAAHVRDVAAAEAVGRAKLGVAAFAEALLSVPKTLAENAGHVGVDAVFAVEDERRLAGDDDPADGGRKKKTTTSTAPIGVDVSTGGALDAALAGIWDNVCVKRQVLQSAPVVASQLLLVDEVLRAGINMRKR